MTLTRVRVEHWIGDVTPPLCDTPEWHVTVKIRMPHFDATQDEVWELARETQALVSAHIDSRKPVSQLRLSL